MSEWQSTTLGALADIVMGQSPPGNACNSVSDGIPLLNGPTEFGSHHPIPVQYTVDGRRYAQRYDILFCVRGSTTGRMNWADKTYAIGRGLASLRHKKGVEYRFYLKALLDYLLPTLLTGVTGSTFPNISKEQLTNTNCFVPPLPEQRAIAHILGTLDDKIELNRRMNQTLEQMAKAIFKSWFVDFDPVRAKAEGRKPFGMDEATAALFPDGFEESKLGEVPKGWKITNLGQLITADKGLSYKGKFLSDGIGLPMINLGCFAGKGKFRQEKVKYYTGEFKPRHLVREGAIVIANTDVTQKRVVLGSPAIVPKINDEEEYLYTHHVYALRFQPETELWRIYVYFSLLRPEFREIAEGFATGTTVLALPRDAIMNYTLCLPPERLLQVFKYQVAVIHKMIQSNLDEVKILGTLRDTLLPKLLSGEVRVKEAEKMMEGV